LTDPLISLIKRIDTVAGANERDGAASFVVFLKTSDPVLNDRLKAIAEREKFRRTTLATTIPEGPKGYAIAREADVTVVLYVAYTVKATYAWRRGELMDKDGEPVVAAFAQMLK
jgi:hypothetical protein